MARIPTVAAPGQAVGTVKTGCTPQPFQRLNAPIEAFGGGDANTPAMLSKSLEKLGADLEEMNKADDKLNSLKMEGELLRTKAEYSNILNLAQGQDRIDIITGTSNGDRLPQGSLQERYNKDLADIRAKYKFITPDSTTLADNLITHNTATFSNSITAGFVSARTSIAKEVTANAIGVAAAGASVAVNSFTEESSPHKGNIQTLHKSLDSHMSKASSIIDDKHVGLGARGLSDPVLLKRTKKEAESKVLQQAFNELISKGMLVEASELLDHYTQKGGRLEGAAIVPELRSQILPATLAIQGRKEYNTLVRNLADSTGSIPNLSTIAEKIYEMGAADPEKSTRLQAILKDNLQLRSAKERELIRAEMDYVAKQVSKGEQVNKEQIPTLLATQPLTAVSLLTGQRGMAFRAAVEKTNNQRQWEAAGGGKVENVAVDTFLNDLEFRDPKRWVQLVDLGVFNNLINHDQFLALRKRRIQVANVVSREEGKLTADVRTGLGALGFDSDKVKAFQTKHGQALNKALADAVRTNPDLSKAVDTVAILANEILKVRTEDTAIGWDKYEFSFLAKDIQDEVDKGTALLEAKPITYALLARMFNVDRGVVENTFESLDEGQRNVKGMADALGKDPLHTMEEEVINRENSDQLVRAFDMPFPARFVEWYVNHPSYGGGMSYSNLQDVGKALVKLKDATVAERQAVMRQWMEALRGQQ